MAEHGLARIFFVVDHGGASQFKGPTSKGMGLQMADSLTGNHRKDGFTPLETIRRFLGVIGSDPIQSRRGGLRADEDGTSSCAIWDLIRP
ncbi:hypothetical protein Tco_0526479 [Tanacetum coccineum]